jgi:DNA gyrase/topoisomerase IV subunit B
MSDIIKQMTLIEAVRKRPGFYLGSTDIKGILNLFCGIITDSICLYKTNDIFFSFNLSNDGNIFIHINFDNDTSIIIQELSNNQHSSNSIYHLRILKAVVEKLEIRENSEGITISFHLDRTVFKEIAIDYLDLTASFNLLAILNKGIKILIKDNTQEHYSQHYLHFPNGIFYLYERTKRKVLGKPKFEILYDGKVNENQYQIALAYRTDWFPESSVLSFANDIHTTSNGTLVTGILDGLALACKDYIKDKKLVTHKIERKKLYNGLIIICSVRGSSLVYGGSFRESLETKEIKTQVKEIIYKLVSDYLNKNEEQAENLLWRFDDTYITRMFEK